MANQPFYMLESYSRSPSAGGSACAQRQYRRWFTAGSISQRPSQTDDRSSFPPISPPVLSPMRSGMLQEQPRSTRTARSGEPSHRAASCPSSALFPTSVREVRPLFQRRHHRPGSCRQPLYPPRDLSGSASGAGRWPALSDSLLAPVAGSPGLRPVCDHSKLGRRVRGKKAAPSFPKDMSPGPWKISPAIWRRTKFMTVPSVFSLRSTANDSVGWLMKSSITIPRKKISCDSSAASIKC